jgi:hypothetical protein
VVEKFSIRTKLNEAAISRDKDRVVEFLNSSRGFVTQPDGDSRIVDW